MTAPKDESSGPDVVKVRLATLSEYTIKLAGDVRALEERIAALENWKVFTCGEGDDSRRIEEWLQARIKPCESGENEQ